MAEYTVVDNETGKEITFDWHLDTPPTDADMDEIFAESRQTEQSEPEAITSQWEGAEKTPLMRGIGEGLTRFGTGVKQTALALGEEIGAVSEDEYQDYTFEEAKRRHQVEQKDWFKNSALGKTGAFLGEVAPWFAFKTRGKTPGARTYEAGAIGGASGAVLFTTEEDDRLQNTLIGMNLGVGGQALVDLRPRTMYMRRKIHEVESDPVWGEALRRSGELGEEGGVLTYAEMTEHPWWIQLQKESMGQKRAPEWKKHKIESLEQTDAALQRNLQAISGETVSPQQAGAMIRSSYKKHMDTIYDAADTEMSAAMRQVDDLVKGKAFVDTDNVIREINQIIGEWKTSGSTAKMSKIKSLETFRDSLQKKKFSAEGAVVGREPRPLTAAEATGKFKSWGKAARGQGRAVFHDEGLESLDAEVAPRIYRAFMDGMDSQMTTLNPNMTRKGMEAFTAARSRYKDAMDYASSVKNSQVGVMMEKAYQKTGSTPDEAFHQVIGKLTPSELRSTLSIMNDVSPQSVNMLRKRIIMDALDQSKLVGKRGDVGIGYDAGNVVKILKKEMAGERGKAWLETGVSMPKEGEIKLLLKKMRKISEYEPQKVQMAGQEQQAMRRAGLEADVLTTGTASQTFLAMAAVRPFFYDSKFVMNVLTNPEARKAVMNLDKPQVGSKLAASIMTLTGLMNETELSRFNDRLEGVQRNPYMFSPQRPTDVLRISPEKMRSGEYVPRIR